MTAKSSYYSEEELAHLGLASYGENVRLSRKASIYGIGNISIGSNVRIDDFCVLSGRITIGNYVHINPFTGIFAGDAGVFLEDFANLASRITIYAVSDDYSGDYMTSPLLPKEVTNITHAPVRIGRHVIIGTGTSILPGVSIGEGCAIGAMSLIKKDCKPWGIYGGIPCRFIKARSRKLLEFAEKIADGQ
jgi:galactoside O-acetyltransferase